MSTTTTTIIVTNTITTRKYKDHLLDPDRVIHKVTDLALMTSLTIRRGKRERPLPRGRSRPPQDFPFPTKTLGSLSAKKKRHPYLVVVTAVRKRSLCAHDTIRHGVILPGILRNRLSVVDHLLTADDHSLHRMRATMVVTVITAVDPKLEGHSSETCDS